MGTLTGTVTDATSKPLAFANVVLLGTTLGNMTDSDGKYTIQNVPVGTYNVKVSFLGYEPQERQVEVNAGQTVNLNFTLNETVVATMDKVVVDAKKEQIRTKDSSTMHRVGEEELERLPVDTFQEAVALKSGVVSQGGQLHFRGGRAGEVQYQIDGIPVNDPLVGGTVNVATVSVSDSEVLLGGFDAEYGNAQSGVINIITQEGGDRFSGEVTYQTDDYGAPDRTYNNFDRLSLGMGGPLPVRNLTYYVSVQGTWSDTYLATRSTRDVTTVLDFIQIRDRQDSELQFQGKLAWRPGPNYKLTFEVLATDRGWENYSHTFSQEGFTETRIDTIPDTGDIVTRFGAFSERQEGPNWLYYNAADHTPRNDRDFYSYKAVWNHTLSRGTFYSLKMSRTTFSFLSNVAGQLPWEYEGRYPDQWRDRINFRTQDFFATNGDGSSFTDRTTSVWRLKTDWTSEFGSHKMKTGFEVVYNDLENFSISFPNRINSEGNIGLVRSDYHVFNTEGSFYVQDRWQHEGMVINAGMRYDVFSVGNQLDASEVESRTRDQWSPRVGIAYPISDRDVFSFHYGRFSQIPDRRFIYENRGTSVQVRGNPDLENETTVSYQAALQHMFTEDVFGQFTVYFKDIFGLLTIQEVSSGDSPTLVNQYVNKDYASSRGFEVSLTKRFTGNFAGELSYTYGQATGVASDPNIQQQVDFLYLPIAEQPLDWDQRHTVSATATIARPGNWAANFVWTLGTGFPFTPRSRNDRQFDPMLTNSRRLPSTSTLTIQAEKHYRIWGQEVRLFLRGNNILDATNIQVLVPGHFPNPPQAGINDYEVFYTETGRAGGAYLGEDLNEDGIQDWVPLSDPRVFQEGRNIRLGVSVRF
jgi:outer membrane receptor protein involved in Fe transport